jgi:hypothetical protein
MDHVLLFLLLFDDSEGSLPSDFFPSLDFSDARNSMYLGTLA